MPVTSRDEPDDRDDPDDDDLDDESTDTIVCRHCGADVYEDADQCPTCGMYIMANTGVWSNKSVVWIALGLLGVLAAILALTLGL
ncbi:MAG: hypothetical protein ACYC6N_15980 [Pirellulaceae bacterium]